MTWEFTNFTRHVKRHFRKSSFLPIEAGMPASHDAQKLKSNRTESAGLTYCALIFSDM